MAEHGGYPLYSCKNCRNPLAFHDDLLSTKFVAKSGPAYMFSYVKNVVLGRKEDRELITGLFTIAEIYCCNCSEELGWMYVTAYDARQKYKEGRFIVEKVKIVNEY